MGGGFPGPLKGRQERGNAFMLWMSMAIMGTFSGRPSFESTEVAGRCLLVTEGKRGQLMRQRLSNALMNEEEVA